MKRVSIVIFTHNDEERITEILKFMANQPYKSLEVIIIDLCSTDQTLDRTRDFPVKVIRLESSDPNIADILNNLAKNLSGEIIFFLDGHSLPKSDNYISIGVKNFTSNNKIVAACGPKLLSYMPLAFYFLRFAKGSSVLNYKEIIFFNLDASAIRKSYLLKHPFPQNCGEPFWAWAKDIIGKGYEIIYNKKLAVSHSNKGGFFKDLKQEKLRAKKFRKFYKKEIS